MKILAIIILCLFSLSGNEMRDVPERIRSVQSVTKLVGLVKNRRSFRSFFTEGEDGAQPRRTCGAYLYPGITPRCLGGKQRDFFPLASGYSGE